MIRSINFKYVSWGMAIMLVFSVIGFIPNQANASFEWERLVDPLCIFACDNNPDVTVRNYYNSNNVNSNINSNVITTVNSSGTTVNATAVTSDSGIFDSGYGAASSGYGYSYGATTDSGYSGSNSGSASVVVNNGSSAYTSTPSPVIINNNNNNTPAPAASPIVINNNSSVVQGSSYAYSGRAPYSYYDSSPIYVSNPVYVSEPVYVQSYPVYNTLYVSCSANTSSTYLNGLVTWTAYVSGGNGYYSYSWSGTDGLYGSSRSVSKYYNNSGQKYAYVTVYSGGQTITKNCSNTVYVSGYYNSYPVYQTYNAYPNYNSSNSGLDIGCYADPVNAKVNQPITWIAEVVGGVGPYTYSWTGSDGLTGNQNSIIKYYSTSGSKSAVVSVTSADGRTSTRACSNALTIASTKVVAKVTPTPVQAEEVKTTNTNQANALFSLANVPWGWVALLVILILFATVLYLMFNRTKI